MTDREKTGERLPSWAQRDQGAADEFKRIMETTARVFERKSLIQNSSEPAHVVYCVMQGWLTISKFTDDGQQQIIDFVLPGEFFDPGSATRTISSTSLAALTRAKVAAIPLGTCAQFLEAHPNLRGPLDRWIAAGYARVAERLLRVGKNSAESRIAYAFCELCLRATADGPKEDSLFHFPLTQQVLGDFVGLSSVHVSRTLRRLRRSAIVETGDHLDIVIRDVGRLAEIAEIDFDELQAEIIPAA